MYSPFTQRNLYLLLFQVEQLFTNLRSEMATYMLRLSNQMFAQGQAMAHHIHRTVALEYGNASSLPLHLQHPALRACQDELEQNLDTSDEFLMHCISLELLTQADMNTIHSDNSFIGRAKRVLIKVDEQGYGGPEKLVIALWESSHANHILAELLAEKLRQCYAAPDP